MPHLSTRARSLTAAVAAALLASGMAACAPESDSTASASPGPVAPVKIRPAVEGATAQEVAQSMRVAFPSWPELSDDDVVAAMNAGCDGLDAEDTPDAGVQAIASYGISQGDAAFTLLASITTFCPEHSRFLTGS